MSDLIDVGLDLETFYDSDYTLSKMTTIEYLLDPRREAIGFSLSYGGLPATWFTGSHQYLSGVLGQIDWSKCRVIAHHAFFDGGILEWWFGYKPAAYFCTMMGSRPYVAPYTGKMSLASVAAYFGQKPKGNEVANHRGRRRADFSPDQLASYGEYCCDDTDTTVGSARELMSYLPDDEQYLLDLTVKKFLRPSICLDTQAIQRGLGTIVSARNKMAVDLHPLGMTPEDIRSRPKFAAALKKRGVTPPTKKSKTTGEDTFAFAKDDDEFVLLRTHDNPEVRLLAEARGMFASSGEQARYERFQRIYDLDFGGKHLLPVPLLYYGAHPGRFSGYDQLNLQNLTRAKKGQTGLRHCLIAPPGHSILAADFSNIEARIVATLAGQWDLVEAFRTGIDIYAQFASRIYGYLVHKDTHPTERFVGKTCILGLGYGMGWLKLQHQLALAGIAMTESEVRRIVGLYRETYYRIPKLWATLEQLLKYAMDPRCMQVWGPLTFAHERIILPNGMPIIYPELRFDNHGGIIFTSKRKKSEGFDNHLWGGAITENVTQALARIIATRAEIRLSKAGLPCAHQAHDELIWCLMTSMVERLKPLIVQAMVDPVSWLPKLPIAVEIGSGASYADCK